ncbi:MAG: extracellular solute-binding protein [Rhizobiales bacterium]|nr:extracellular solute-binding protein [Hyphomicrobiales bacterium]
MAVSAIALTSVNSAFAADPITILINNSPWYGGFEALVEKYEAETGNKVNIDRTPYSGVLEKVRNSVRGDTSPYDLVNLDNGWIIEFYSGGFLTPLTNIDPDFKLSDEIIDNGEAIYWNSEKQWPTKEGGKLMAFSPNGNAHMWYYRSDLIDTPPATYKDILKNCAANHNPPNTYGAVLRGERGNPIRFSFMPHMLTHGGSILKDPKNGDFTITFNSPENLKALNMFLKIHNECSADNPGAIGQGEMIQLVLSGKAAQAGIVIAAQAQMDNPEKSAVVGKINYAQMPYLEGGSPHGVFGSWQMAVPNNISDGRKTAALEFIKYFISEKAQTLYAEAGGIPIHTGVLRGPLATQEKFRWMKPYAAVAENATQVLMYKEGAEVEQIIGLRLNQALIGELTASEALNVAAKEIYNVLAAAGRDTKLGNSLMIK